MNEPMTVKVQQGGAHVEIRDNGMTMLELSELIYSALLALQFDRGLIKEYIKITE